jgi:hypothetical protein
MDGIYGRAFLQGIAVQSRNDVGGQRRNDMGEDCPAGIYTNRKRNITKQLSVGYSYQ